MSLSDTSKILLAIKKLKGKAHTSNDKDLANEDKPSGITMSSTTIFGKTISTAPTSTEYTITSDSVEFLRLSASFIAGTDTDDGRHGFALKLPDDYESNSSNSNAGTYPYINSQLIYITSGALQLVPPSFSTNYEAKIYHTGSGETRIPVLDASDWSLDYFNGVFFQQDPPGTGDDSSNPRYVDAYLYVGDYLSDIVSSGDITSVTAGTGLTGGGASGGVTLTINDSVVATLSGSQFSGNVGVTGSIEATSFFSGSMFKAPVVSGSLTKLHDGTSYIRAGNNITVTSASNGYITITGTSTGDITSVVAGTGLTGGGAAGDVTLNIDDSVVATISGSTFSGVVAFDSGLSGSLTRLTDGTSYLAAGTGITITSASNGQVTIANVGSGEGDITAVLAGTGLTDGGTSGAVTLNIDDSVVATLTGSQFSGNIGVTGSIGATTFIKSLALTGSLTKLTDGTSYLQAGDNITIVSGSSGQITITSTDTNTDTQNTLDQAYDEGATGAGAIITVDDQPIQIKVAGASSVALVVTGTAIFGSSSVATSNHLPPLPGTNVSFYVSGSQAPGSATSNSGVAVFGGDVVISGTLFGGSPLKVGGDFEFKTKEGVTPSVKNPSGSIKLFASKEVKIGSDRGIIRLIDLGGSTAGKIYMTGSETKADRRIKIMTAGQFHVTATNFISDALSNDFVRGMIINSGAWNGTVGDFQVQTKNKSHAIYLNTTTHKVSILSTNDYVPSDIGFFVSGSKNSTSGSLFGGDLVVSGGFKVNGTTLVVDQSNNRVGIGTVPTAALLDVDGDAVFNKAGADKDFRVVSPGAPAMLYVDGGNNRVGVGLLSVRSPDAALEVVGAGDASETVRLMHGGSVYGSVNPFLNLNYANASTFTVYTDGANHFVLKANHESIHLDTISSKNLLLQESGGKVGIGTTSPEHELSVVGIVSASLGFSGSLTRLTDASSYLVAGDNVTISSSSNGQITITASTTAGSTTTSRTKTKYHLTESVTEGANFQVGSTNFNTSGHKPKNIDVFLNGQLLHSGTAGQVAADLVDYTIINNSTLRFSSQLEASDVVDTITYLTASTGAVRTAVQKTVYAITASHTSDVTLNISGLDLSVAEFDPDKIAVFLNGQMMTSGTNYDYVLAGSSNNAGVQFKFDLEKNDIVTTWLV